MNISPVRGHRPQTFIIHHNLQITCHEKTKIVCTIGPKTESEEMLTNLLEAGMNVMRLNFSHGDYEEHGRRIANIRAVMEKTGRQAAILLDTKGPEIRTMKLEGGNDVSLKAGQTLPSPPISQ